MIATIACQNLFHDKVRLCVTLTGIIFAVVLITVQVGLFLGFIVTISGVIDNAGADIWVTSRGIKNFDMAIPLKEGKLYEIRGIPGVADARRMVVDHAFWKKADGGQESIEIVAFESVSDLGGPWNIVRGEIPLLDVADTVFIDELYVNKLGVTTVGEEVEIRGERARVVGFTFGIRSFTTLPYVFTDIRNAARYTSLEPNEMTYVLVRAAEGVSPSVLRKRISSEVRHVDVFTTPQFSRKTQEYWMLSTGAGVALMLAAVLGLVVGMVVVAQTLYATTMDHLSEFATMKAMGAPNSYIYKIIVIQATISAVLGYSLGMTICAYIVRLNKYGEAALLLPWQVAAGMLVLTLFMCVSASFISIRKVTSIDPAVVFKGR